MAIIQGPVPASMWGRIWARALITPAFNTILERDMRQGVSEFLRFCGLPVGTFVEPLFDDNHRMACQSLKDFYHALEELKDKDSAKFDKFVDDDPTLPANDSDIVHILTMTRPNRWTLTELVTGDTCEMVNDLAPGAAKPHLNRKHWARVYAAAVKDSSYLATLKRDPKTAIDNFPGARPLPHTAGNPILRLPTLAELRAHPSLPINLQAPGALDTALAEIVQANCMGYEATLCVSLSC